MRHVTLWLLLLASPFWLLALPKESEGMEQIESGLPAQQGGEFIFVWPDGRRAPAILRPNGIVTLPDGSVPQGGITLQLPDGRHLPVPPSGYIDLPRAQGIREYGGKKQPGMQQTPGIFPPAYPEAQGESRISLHSLSQEELMILQQGGALQYHPNGQLSPITVLPDGSVRLQDGSMPQQDIQLLLPDGSLKTLSPGEKLDPAKLGLKNRQSSPGNSVEPSTKPSAILPQPGMSSEKPAVQPVLPSAQTPGKAAQVPPSSQTPVPGTPPATAPVPSRPQDMLAYLLPTTPIPQDFQTPSINGKSANPSPGKKEEVPKTHKAPQTGDPLNIPPDAARNGDLSFLEGCWEGTRPEYISKRTIRECFCFSKRGANGKRRIFDPAGSRQCIGATRATLSKNGVLRVYSESAYCSDGVKWGAANMTCRGKGKTTPCSWVFTDANGGRQSYEINFVRVESCRR